jgi:ABC-type sulfate transport system substrate-binding protein
LPNLPVAIVDKVVDKRGTRQVAEAYLQYLYSEEGQEIAAKHFYRPNGCKSCRRNMPANFPVIELFTIDDAFGGWKNAHKSSLCRWRHI